MEVIDILVEDVEDVEVDILVEVAFAEVELELAAADMVELALDDALADILPAAAPTDMGVTVPFADLAFWYQSLPQISATFPTVHPIC